MKRILLIGANGQLGEELKRVLEPSSEVTGVGREQVDLTQPESIYRMMKKVQPEVVINTAAYTAVDRAESEPEIARAINGTAPGVLAKLAAEIGARLIHISTDYVFDGTSHRPYLETDKTNPLSVYGQSKLIGERAIQEAGANYAILRTAWVYGAGRTGNFVKTMLRLGAEREEISVVTDQVGSPTWTRDLAEAIASLVPLDETGTYHYTNSGVASWYDFAVAIFEEAKHLGFPIKVQRIRPITTAEYPTPAKRPAYSVLSCAKISAALDAHPPHWRQSLRKMLPQLLSK